MPIPQDIVNFQIFLTLEHYLLLIPRLVLTLQTGTS